MSELYWHKQQMYRSSKTCGICTLIVPKEKQIYLILNKFSHFFFNLTSLLSLLLTNLLQGKMLEQTIQICYLVLYCQQIKNLVKSYTTVTTATFFKWKMKLFVLWQMTSTLFWKLKSTAQKSNTYTNPSALAAS